MADRRRRQAELVGGAGEIQVPGRRFQRPQRRVYRVQKRATILKQKFNDPVKTTRFPFCVSMGDGGDSKKSSNRILAPESLKRPCPSLLIRRTVRCGRSPTGCARREPR